MQLAGFWRAGRSLVSTSSTADRCVTDQPTAGPLAKASQPLGAETYIVLDLAGPAAAEVRRARRARGYDFYGALPVEVTVAGSSGLGTPAPDQDVRQVFSTLDRIAADTPIITGRFGPMLRFPDTNIFVLTMEDPQPFIDLHQRIGESEIEFLPSPFPFIPIAQCEVRLWVRRVPRRLKDSLTCRSISPSAARCCPPTRLRPSLCSNFVTAVTWTPPARSRVGRTKRLRRADLAR